MADSAREADQFGVLATLQGIDVPAVNAYRDGVVSRLHQGLTGLIKGRGIQVIEGEGRVTGPRQVTVGDRTYTGKHLVLATGSSATVPPIEGAEHGRVYRTLEDVDSLVADLAAFRLRRGRPASVVVVGGGLLGLEAAGGAHRLGARTALRLDGE